jgi:DNA-binding transcriptional MerR regulator
MMRLGEAAQLLNVHANTLRRGNDSGIIISERIGPRGDRRFIREDIVKLAHGLHKYGGDVKKVNMV